MTETSRNNSDKTSQTPVMYEEDGYMRNVNTQMLYLHDVGQFPRMTPEEELFYARQFQDSRYRINDLVRKFTGLIYYQLSCFAQDKGSMRINNFMDIDGSQEDTGIREVLGKIMQKLKEAFEIDEKGGLKIPAEQEQQFWQILSPLALHDSFFDKCLDVMFDDEKRRQYVPEDVWNDISDELKECCRLKREAHETLVNRNLRLVIAIAKNYQRSNMSFQDLIQEGNIGLMRAVEKYDYRLGHRLSTYASYWIRQAITRAQANHSRTIRISTNMLKQVNDIKRAERILLKETGLPPTPEEIADWLKLPHAKVRALMKMVQQPISLQTALSEDSELADIIPDDDAVEPSEAAAISSLRDSINKVLKYLDDREKTIIVKRFGLEDGQPMTLTQISEMMGLSSERVRQLEASAIKKLRAPSSKKYFDGYE